MLGLGFGAALSSVVMMLMVIKVSAHKKLGI